MLVVNLVATANAAYLTGKAPFPTRRLEKAHDLLEGVQDTVRISPSRTTRLRVSSGVDDFSSKPVGIRLMRNIWRVSVGVDVGV